MEEAVKHLPRAHGGADKVQATWEGDLLNMVEPGSLAPQPVPQLPRPRSDSVKSLPPESPRVASTEEAAHRTAEPPTESPGLVRRVSSLQRKASARSTGASGSLQQSPGSSRYPLQPPVATDRSEERSTGRSGGAHEQSHQRGAYEAAPSPSLTQGGETPDQPNAGTPIVREETTTDGTVVSLRSQFDRQASSGQGFDPQDASGGYSGAQIDQPREGAAV